VSSASKAGARRGLSASRRALRRLDQSAVLQHTGLQPLLDQGSGLPDAALRTVSPGSNEDLPVPPQEMCVHGSKDDAGWPKVLAMTDPCLLPSACHDAIGTPHYIAFAAQYLAYTPPYQRFAHCLTAVTRA
jgi:hypothetical protein